MQKSYQHIFMVVEHNYDVRNKQKQIDMDDIKRKTTCCLYITTVSSLRWNRDGVRVKQRDRQPIQCSPTAFCV